MKTILLLLTTCVLLSATAYAQSGQWTRPGTWHMSQSHRVVEFNGRMWCVGGANINSDSHTFDQIRSSTDGIDWVQEVAIAPFGPRANHGLVVFNNRIWVIGGSTTFLFGLKNDVWSSADGVHWVLETAGAPWAARASHATLVHDNRLWVMGGRTPSQTSDVWSSLDGVNWTQESSAAPWHGRYEHAGTTFMGRMWICGGQSGTVGESNDIWSSTDGIAWTLEAASSPWPVRSAHTVSVFNNELWLMGGGWSFHNDVWKSGDGVNWTQVTADADWNSRRAHGCVVFNNRMWVTGGFFETDTSEPFLFLRRDIWSSSDGANWQFETDKTGWSPRFSLNAISFNGKLWVVGGGNSDYTAEPDSVWFQESAEVWSSVDGADWTLEVVAPFSPRLGHATVVFNGRMWVIGGGSDLGNRDVWSTADGVNWIQNTAMAQWSAREGLGAVVFNNRIYIMGGVWMGLERKDVWSSVDGVNWRLETNNPGWSKRRYPNVVSFNNRMWLISGLHTVGMSLVPDLDIWSSADGVVWTQEVAVAPFLERGWPSFAVFDNQIWMLGGYWYNGLNDVWSTRDGVNWNLLGNAPWPGRSQHVSAVHAGKLWILGGGWTGDPLNDVWSFELASPPQLTSTPQTAAAVGIPYTYQITATGAPTPMISASGLPAWLSLNGNTLSGTPTMADVGMTATITVTATNSMGADAQVFQINVVDGPVITSTPPATAQIGVLYTYDVIAGGTPAPMISATGLPGWLALNGNTISGTPGAGEVGLTAPILVIATNPSGTDMQSFQIDVQGIPPQITSTPVYAISEGSAYSYSVTATGTPSPGLSATGLPAWLSFDPGTGTFSGTPGHADIGITNAITVTASNGWGPDAVQVFSIDVQAAIGSGGGTGGGGGCVANSGASAWGWLLAAWLLATAGIRAIRRGRVT
ncbi:MAG: putative Ig domain-containing protein [Planctomycetes bacterium]|nr:putative Ig domain-containing protein [Planctomycetota bacterium]